MGLFIKNKRRGRKIINHHIRKGQGNPILVSMICNPRRGLQSRGLQIMDTRMGFPCPFHSVVIDSINLGLHASTGICDIVSSLSEICHSGTDTSNIFYYSQVFSGLIESITTLREGRGNPIRVSKICNPWRGLPSRGCCKSWTHGDGIPESLPQRDVWLFFSYLLNV